MKKIILFSVLFSLSIVNAQGLEKDKKSILLKLNYIEKCFLLARDTNEYKSCENKLIGLANILKPSKPKSFEGNIYKY